MAKVRNNPRLAGSDVIDLVAKKSTLTKTQVKECFFEFAELYKSLMASDNTPEDFTMALPYIGTFKLKKFKGMKKGDIYKVGNFTGGLETKVAQEDYPDFNIPMFNIKPEIREMRKEASKRRWCLDRERKDG